MELGGPLQHLIELKQARLTSESLAGARWKLVELSKGLRTQSRLVKLNGVHWCSARVGWIHQNSAELGVSRNSLLELDLARRISV